MSGVTMANLGAAVGAVAVIYVLAQQLPSIIKAIKGAAGQGAANSQPTGSIKEDDSKEEFKTVLENNTAALVELTQFLKTQAAVDKEKERHSEQQLMDINTKLDKLSELMREHCIKCDGQCRA